MKATFTYLWLSERRKAYEPRLFGVQYEISTVIWIQPYFKKNKNGYWRVRVAMLPAWSPR